MGKNHLLWMLLGCGLMIVILAIFGDRLSSGWLFALVIGACVVPHLFMMRGHHSTGSRPDGGAHLGAQDVDAHAHGKEESPTHKGGCCH